jgi:hypothetical protein
MSLHIKSIGKLFNSHILNSSVDKITENTKNNINQYSNIKHAENRNQLLNQNIKVNYISNTHSTCVTNLNLTTMHIDKIQSEITEEVYNRNVINTLRLTKLELERERKESNNNQVFEEPVLSELDIYHIELITDLYLKVETHNPCFKNNLIIIIIIYQKINNTNLINKQLITAITIENNIPKKSICEITIINHSGELKKYTKKVYLHNGGLTYTDDWLKLQQTKILNIDNTFYKLQVHYQNRVLNGIALNNSTSGSFSLDNSTIYIPNFSKIWR